MVLAVVTFAWFCQGNWRSFLDDLTTGVGDPVAPPLMSSFGFQKTAVLATDRELKIFVNIFVGFSIKFLI